MTSSESVDRGMREIINTEFARALEAYKGRPEARRRWMAAWMGRTGGKGYPKNRKQRKNWKRSLERKPRFPCTRAEHFPVNYER